MARWLKASLARNGMDTDNKSAKGAVAFADPSSLVNGRNDERSTRQGVGSIHAHESIADIVKRLASSYAASLGSDLWPVNLASTKARA